jgi:uncharacterized membrane protein
VAKQLVLGIFPSLESAESAVKNLLSGASDYSDMHVGSIGILVLDDKGKLKEIKRGQRMGGRGATIGLAVAALTPVGLIAGLAGGAALGHFRQQGPKFSAEDQARLAAKLEGGKAALGVIVQAAQADLMADVMNGLGGTVQAHEVDISDEELAAAEAAMTAAAAEAPEA